MKKLLFTAIMAITIISCDNRGDVADASKKELNGNFVRKTNGNEFGKGKPGVVASFTFTAGRQSKKCHGFGICELTAFGIEIIEMPEQPQPKADIVSNETDKYSATVYLNQVVDENEFDTTFYIDNDLEGKDEEGNFYIIKKGAYRLDSSIGEFGGYELEVDKIN